eukprot:COSAG06_NODE_5272_length_3594_cov_2.084979_2_plen_76_part_00
MGVVQEVEFLSVSRYIGFWTGVGAVSSLLYHLNLFSTFELWPSWPEGRPIGPKERHSGRRRPTATHQMTRDCCTA